MKKSQSANCRLMLAKCRVAAGPQGSCHVLAAIRRESRSGDEAGFVRGEKNHRSRNLLRLAQTADLAQCSSPRRRD
jgi:hypothetical protein